MQKVSNHPVHILNSEDILSPSSFIPFCAFGEEFIGADIPQFDIPVCNIFKPKNHLDQLCYELDLQEMKDSKKLAKQLERGLTLILDYNEERQIHYNITTDNVPHQKKALYSNDDNTVSIYLDTISINNSKLYGFWYWFKFLDPVGLFGEGQYNLLSLKEISVTDSFLGLDREIINCQNIEAYDECRTRHYVDKLRQECGCLPITLRLSEMVKWYEIVKAKSKVLKYLKVLTSSPLGITKIRATLPDLEDDILERKSSQCNVETYHQIRSCQALVPIPDPI